MMTRWVMCMVALSACGKRNPTEKGSTGDDRTDDEIFDIDVSATGPGSIRLEIAGVPVELTDGAYDGLISEGDSATLTALPNLDATFVGWSGSPAACSGSQPSITFAAPHEEDIDCTATFETTPITTPDPTTLTLNVSGGSVAVTDAQGNTSSCDATSAPCEVEVDGETVTVEATPDTPGDLTIFDPPCPDGPGDSCVFDLVVLDPDGDLQGTVSVSFEPPAPTGCLDKADLPFLELFADEADWCAGAATPQQEPSLVPGGFAPLVTSDVELTAAYGVHISSFDVSAFPDLACNRPNVRCVENGFVAPVGPTTLVVVFRTGTTTAASLDEQTTLGISVDDGSPPLDPYWGEWSSGGGLRLTLSTFQNFVFADGIRADGTSFTTQGMKGGRVVEDGQLLLFVLPHQPINATMSYRAHTYHAFFDTYEGDAWTAPALGTPYASIVTLP